MAYINDRTSGFLGWMVARAIAGQRMAQKEPVAYLYNGVRLPKLPEWDMETFPYATICQGKTTIYFYVCSGQDYCDNDGQCYWPGGEKAIQWELVDGEWVSYYGEFDWGPDEFQITVLSHYIWSSFDILYTDGTVAFAASEPIPVYE